MTNGGLVAHALRWCLNVRRVKGLIRVDRGMKRAAGCLTRSTSTGGLMTIIEQLGYFLGCTSAPRMLDRCTRRGHRSFSPARYLSFLSQIVNGGCNLGPPFWTQIEAAIDGMASCGIPMEEDIRQRAVVWKNSCYGLMGWYSCYSSERLA